MYEILELQLITHLASLTLFVKCIKINRNIQAIKIVVTI